MVPQVVVTVATKVLPAAVALSGSVAVRAPGAAGGAVQPATRAARRERRAALGEAARWATRRRPVSSRAALHRHADADEAADHQQHGQDDRDDLAVAADLGLPPLPRGLLLLVAAPGTLSLTVVRRHLVHSVPAAASGRLPLTAVSLGTAPVRGRGGRLRVPPRPVRAGPTAVPGRAPADVRLAVVLTIGFPAAAFATNCYVLAPGAGQECLVVDPGIGVEQQLAEVLREHRLKPAAVLLTHGHLDHVYSVTPVCGAASVAAYIHGDDRYRLKDPLSLLEPSLVAMLEQQFGTRATWREPEDVVTLADQDAARPRRPRACACCTRRATPRAR